MKYIQLIILIHLFVSAIPQSIVLIDPYLKFDQLTKSEGLSDHYILDIYQDDEGFIWIGTKDGLNRFNGYDFEIFRHNADDSLSISGNIITSIVQDTAGGLWVGTTKGLNKYVFERNEFQRFTLSEKNKSNLPDQNIRDLYADKDNILWIETASGVLYRYDLTGRTLNHYKHRKPYMINTYFYHSIHEDSEGILWVGGRNMGIFKFDPVACVFEEIIAHPTNSTKKRDRDITTYFTDSDGEFWVCGIDGAYTYNPENNTFNKILPISTFGIQEDNHGKLWLGTGSGLYVYDKINHRFKVYKHNVEIPSSLIDNQINKVFIDRTGNVWVGTTDGISIYRPHKNKFDQIFHVPGDNNTPVSNSISALLQDEKGNIWLGTNNEGLDVFDLNFNKLAHYGKEAPLPYRLVSDKISVLSEDSDHEIWVGQWAGRGFNIIDPATKAFQSYAIFKNSLSVDWYNAIQQDKAGNNWVGIWGGVGLYKFDKEKKVFEDETYVLLNANVTGSISKIIVDDRLVWLKTNSLCFPAFDMVNDKYNLFFPEHKNWIKSLKVNDLILDQDNDLWYATNKGLYRKEEMPYIYFNPMLGKVNNPIDNNILAIARANNKNRLWLVTPVSIEFFNKKTKSCVKVSDFYVNDNPINFIMEDKDNQLWIGTRAGLYKKEGSSKPVVKYYDLYSPARLAHEISINCYLKAGVHGFWLGTSLGLFYYDYSHKKFMHSKLLLGREIFSLLADSSGNIWAGTDDGLLNIFDGTIPSIDKNFLLKGKKIYSLSLGERKNLWVATGSGLYRVKFSGDTLITHLNLQNKYLSSHLVSCVFEDSQGNIWVGTTNKGLNKIEVNTGCVQMFESNTMDSTSFWGNEVSCIVQDRTGNIWVGGAGLNCYLPDKNRFIHYTVHDGLVDNNIRGILEGVGHNLWISTSNGLSKFDRETKRFENFSEKDGLCTNEFTKACTRLFDNRLLFGTKKGLTVVQPDPIIKNTTPPNIHISKLKIFDKETDPQLLREGTISLSYKQNYFSFEFAALDYSNPSENEYAYLLENFDKDWTATDAAHRKAKYTNVPPGDYIFRVKAANCDGVWNEKGAVVKLAIAPPYWKRWWFYLLEGVFLIGIIWFFIRFRIKNIKEKNKLLILEQKLLRSQMNPHFIFNSLTSIQSFIFEGNPLEAGTYLAKFSELIRSILHNSREEYVSLEKEISTLDNYLNIQKLRYGNKFNYEIVVDEDMDIQSLAVPPMLAQPFVENSIEHGIKPLEKLGYISIRFSFVKGLLMLLIEDNGIGIKASMKRKGKQAKNHQSLALIITKERIKILNKRRRNKSCSMKIEDIVGAENTVQGTRIEFFIPFIKI